MAQSCAAVSDAGLQGTRKPTAPATSREKPASATRSKSYSRERRLRRRGARSLYPHVPRPDVLSCGSKGHAELDCKMGESKDESASSPSKYLASREERARAPRLQQNRRKSAVVGEQQQKQKKGAGKKREKNAQWALKRAGDEEAEELRKELDDAKLDLDAVVGVCHRGGTRRAAVPCAVCRVWRSRRRVVVLCKEDDLFRGAERLGLNGAACAEARESGHRGRGSKSRRTGSASSVGHSRTVRGLPPRHDLLPCQHDGKVRCGQLHHSQCAAAVRRVPHSPVPQAPQMRVTMPPVGA
jgi:hypothetical protein